MNRTDIDELEMKIYVGYIENNPGLIPCYLISVGADARIHCSAEIDGEEWIFGEYFNSEKVSMGRILERAVRGLSSPDKKGCVKHSGILQKTMENIKVAVENKIGENKT